MGIFFTRHTRVRKILVGLALIVGTHGYATTSLAQTDPPCPGGGDVAITREIPVGFPPVTFTYEVRGPDSDVVVDTVTFAFEEGHDGSVQQVAHTPPGMVGDYRLVEVDTPEGLEPSTDVLITIESPTCGAPVNFTTIVHPSAVRVVNTETVGSRRKDAAIGKWTFTLAGGPYDVSITKRTNTNGNKHALRFVTWGPGEYTLCERFTGWRSNLGKGSGYYRPNGDRCVDFVLTSPEVQVFRVNNRCPLS